MSRVLPIVAIASTMLTPVASYACETGERLRLTDEIENLTKKNAWSGVERKFNELEKMRCLDQLDADTFLAAAQAAQRIGKTFEMFERLSAAQAIDPTDEIQANIDGILNNYGRVHIRGSARKRATLIREVMPFPPDQRKSIEYAQSVMEGKGSFRGMLPAGEYQVADITFKVEAGQEFQEILVGKVKPKKSGDMKSAPQVKDAGAINWMGLVVMAGGGLWGTAQPSLPVYDPDNPRYPNDGTCDGTERLLADQDECIATTRQPGTIPLASTPIVDLTAGWEVGLTYAQPEIGVVALMNLRRTPTRKFNQATLQVGPVVRPGMFRLTAGLTWGLVWGKTRSYATWTAEGQYNVDLDNPAELPEMRGWAMGGGLAGSAGAALFEMGPFEGAVEIHGHWMRDDVRSYSGIGVRIGVVPKLERFQE